MITEIYPESEPLPSTAGLVCLRRTLRSGDTTEEWLTYPVALWEALYSPLLGAEVVSARVLSDGVSEGTVGVSGSSLCVEWSSIRNRNDFVT